MAETGNKDCTGPTADTGREAEPSVDPYRAMLELAGRELALATAGHFDEISELAATWTRLRSVLPASPPRGARASLRRTAELQRQTRSTLLAHREQMLSELRHTTHASRAAGGYARVAPRAVSRVDRNA